VSYIAPAWRHRDNGPADCFVLRISDFSAQITPFASRTFQFTKEQLGQADDKVRCSAVYSAKTA
jgi:hypothetical protein